MRRLVWPLLLVVTCLPLILIALGYVPAGFSSGASSRPSPVPSGEHEIAWLNTSTSGAVWERFVVGVQEAVRNEPGWSVDAKPAFPRHSMKVPEVVLHGPTRTVRIRWYRLTSQQREADWVRALAARDPAPLAVIGGASSDRARDLAIALNAEKNWQGEPPLLFITNATAENVQMAGDPGTDPDTPLMNLYPKRTFRVCFRNSQMAEAMLDFLWQPELNLRPNGVIPRIERIAWLDDPYSTDMVRQCEKALPALQPAYMGNYHEVRFSVGEFTEPNPEELRIARDIVRKLQGPSQRVLLIVPTVTSPARRFLRTIAEADPALCQNLVAVNGDGMGVNAVLRDGDYLWPVESLPVPLIMFTHAHPTAWNDTNLLKPASTDDVLLTAELIRQIGKVLLEPGPLTSDSLQQKLHAADPPFFDADGNRRSGTKEFIFLLQPRRTEGDLPTRRFEVWQRQSDRRWQRVAEGS